MERITFNTFSDLADCMIDKMGEGTGASVVCYCEYATALLHELIKKDCTVLSAQITEYEYALYDHEYLVSLSNEGEIIVEPLYARKEDGHTREGYVYHEDTYIYVHQDCNSEILKYLCADHMCEISVLELDEECEHYKDDAGNELSEAHHLSFDPDGHLCGVQKSWNNYVDGISSYTNISFYCDDESKVREFAKDFGIEIK